MTDYLREQLGTSLGTAYTLERELGGGGMSRVFVARDEALGRDVVVKVLDPELVEGLSVERFLREVKLTAGLQAPHIVPVLTAGSTASGLPYYTMPFVPGETLRTRLAEGPLTMEAATSMLRDIATALEYAHARGVVHRDIKPENVLLNGRTAVVTDFGIAKALSASRADTSGNMLTQVGTSLGTPAYMAPEQAAGDPATDHRADLYAWGMIAYEIFAGRHPFADRPTPLALIAAQFVEMPPAIAECRSDLPPSIAAIVMRCLEKEPDERPTNAAALIAALSDSASFPAPPERTTPGTNAPRATNHRSMVVLPFANLSADADNEYFSDGLTDEIIADLSRIQALKVISRTSAMVFKGSDKGIRFIASELGVRYALEGSVRKSGNNLRITARLVDAASDAQCWADKYTGTLDDIFDLQERVSREIVRALDVTLSADEDRRLGERSIDDAAAYDRYLRARHEVSRGSAEGLDRATALLREGLEIVGENVRLRATMSYLDVIRMRMRGQMDRPVFEAIARQAHDMLRREPDSGAAHFLLGTAEFELGRLQEAAVSFARALRADPHDVDAHAFLGIVYLYAGHIDAAGETLNRLRRIDPLSIWPHGLLAPVAWFDGRASEGVESMSRCLELGADGPIWRWHWGYQLVLVERLEDAAAEAAHMMQLDATHPYSLQLFALTAALRGDRELALDAVRRLDTTKLDPHLTFHVAECYVRLGDHERACDLIDSAIARGFHPFAFIAEFDPLLATLRTDARFASIAAEAQRRWRRFVVQPWVNG